MERSRKLRGVLILTALSAGCAGSPLTIEDISLDSQPNARAPLTATVGFSTSRATTVALTFDDGERSWTADVRRPAANEHVVPILGMRPGRVHNVRIVVTDEEGNTQTSESLEIVTAPLPEDFPPIDVRVSLPDRMEPGITMLEPTYRSEDGSERDHLLVAVDAAGEVVWYYTAPHSASNVRRLRNGNLSYRTGRAGPLFEIDMLGNTVGSWQVKRTPEDLVELDGVTIDAETLHHDVFETSAGTFLGLTTELRRYDEYPTSETDPDAPTATSEVLGDMLVEFNRQGHVLRSVKLLDLLDPYRIGYGSLGWGGAWSGLFPEEASVPRRNWSHTNAVSVDDSGRYVIASVRHQDAVVKIDWETGQLVWILGNHDGWGPEWQKYLLEPNGPVVWPYHQHAPMITPDGTVLMFDNGNYRARPFQKQTAASDSFSRAVEYRVDEDRKEVTEVWSYGGPGDEPYFARFVGDADWMPTTGNILVNYGGLVSDNEGNPVAEGNGHNWVRVVEVTHETPAEKVFELFIDDGPPAGWSVFRTQRLPGLYP